jgi:hypothetical protein
MRGSRRCRRLIGSLAVIGAYAGFGALSAPAGADGAASSTNLVGTFSIAAGQCAQGGAPSGSYLQIQVEGIAIPNVSSPCLGEGGAFTPLTQGAIGLVTGDYQPDPVPTFTGSGDSLAASIVRPVRFLANALGLATTCANQTAAPTASGACGHGVNGFPAPSLSEVLPGQGGCPATTTGDCLDGDLSSLGATWAGLPVKSLSATTLLNPTSLLSSLGKTCVNDSGCDAIGVADEPGAASSTCVTPSDPGSCALFGTIDPKTHAYTLALSTGIALGVLPDAVLHLVLRGTFTPAAPGSSLLAGLEPGVAPGTSTGSSGSPSAPANATPGQGATGPGSSAATAAGGVEELTGTLALSPASCVGTTPVGSFLTVAFSTASEGNPSSTCDGGAYTLLQPGSGGLGFGAFTPDPSPTFDANGNSLANAIVTPTLLKGHLLGLGTSPDDVQDAPEGPATFAPPVAVVQGENLAVDLRSLNVTYNGPPGTACPQSFGVGCWLEGSRIATGTYDPTSGNVTLDWYSSQDFTGGSGEVDFHLSGHFDGTASAADPSVLTQLASSSYVVTGSSIESESFPPDSNLSRSTNPTAAPVPTTVPSTTSSRVVRMSEAGSAPGAHGGGGSWAPVGIIGLGVLVMLGLLLAGRRSRHRLDAIEEELR